MNKLDTKNRHKLIDIIKFIIESKEEYIMDNYDLYVKKGEENISILLTCYLSDEGIDIDDNDNEIYPQFIIENELEYFCSGQLLEDVIHNALHQMKNKKKAKEYEIKQFIISLDYYLEHDNFLTIT